MKTLRTMAIIAGLGLALSSCTDSRKSDFKYSIDQFADIEVLRYQIPEWDNLTLQQKEYIYHLCEAAKCGRDITWDQNFKYNLRIRHILEAIYDCDEIDRSFPEWEDFEVYAKRVFFSNGIHHHYGDYKILPECSDSYLRMIMGQAGISTGEMDELIPVMMDPTLYPTAKYQGTDKDLVANSSVNFYENLTAAEVNAFYDKMADPQDKTPISYGLNSRLVKKNGKIYEEVYKVGGLYGNAIEKIISHLESAA